MATVDFGICHPFVKDLWSCGLLKQVQLKLIADFLQRHAGAGAPQLGSFLIEQGILTRFQVSQILAGHGGALVLWVYTLVEPISSGTRGDLFKALSKSDQQLYAIRLLPRRNTANIPKTSRQIKTFQDFRHPAVVSIVHIGKTGNRNYLVWPYVEGGETLARLVDRQGALAQARVLRLGLQVAEALKACHDKDLFHGILKASDVLIGKEERIRLLDFGMGYLLTIRKEESLLDTSTSFDQLASGLDFASPESLLDGCNRTALGDQYSLGCILYYGLSGRLPFPEGSVTQKIMQHQFEEAKPLSELAPQISVRLEAVVQRMMRKEPAERFGSMQEVIDALKMAGRAAPTASVRLPGSARIAAKKVLSAAAVIPSRELESEREPAVPESKPWLVWGAVGVMVLMLVVFLLWRFLR